MYFFLACATTAASDEAPSSDQQPPVPSVAEPAPAPPTCPPTFPDGQPAQGLLIQKAAHLLGYYEKGVLASFGEAPACFPASLGFTPEGHKQREGDGKTPEGSYRIYHKNPKSSFYLSLGISYPNADDAKGALEAGIIDQSTYQRILKSPSWPPQNTAMGGLIYIHGGGVGSDWTWGCVALENEHIKYLFDRINVGASVRILP